MVMGLRNLEERGIENNKKSYKTLEKICFLERSLKFRITHRPDVVAELGIQYNFLRFYK